MSLDLEKFFSLSLEMFCVAGTDGYFKKINPAFSRILGYPRHYLLGKPFLDFVHPSDKAATILEVENLSNGQATTNFVNRYRTNDGAWKWFDWIAVPDGELIYATARDITEQKNTEIALGKAERLASIGTLAAGIAHELNNPIGLLQLQVDNLLEDPSVADSTRIRLEKMRSNIDRSTHIIRSILRFARKESSEKSLVDVADLIEAAVEMSSRFIAKKEIQVRVETNDNLLPILGNAVELEQVLLNIIHNSTIACDGKGQICLRAIQTEPGLRLTIEDNGAGMNEEEMQRAFYPFFTTRQDIGGTGLGLSTCHGIISDHKGKIQIESALGKGTIVSIFIPSVENQETLGGAVNYCE
jgi:PAS domain S-box-containing protein